MTEVQRLVKDSVLSIVTVDNFEENVVSGRNILINLSKAALQYWWLAVKKNTVEGIEYLDLYIRIGEIHSQMYSTEVGITLKNENSKASRTRKFIVDYVVNDSWGCHRFNEMSRLLAENSGFLRNGALTVQCEVRVYAITDRNGIRKFNFHDPFEGCVRFKREHGEKTYYAMKEMVMYHSPMLAERIADGEEEFTYPVYSTVQFEWFLRLIHGLSAEQLPQWTLSGVLDYAIHFDTFGVIKRSEALFSKTLNKVHVSAKFELIRLKRQFQSAKSLEELKEVVVVKCGEDRLDSKMMQRAVSKFFSLAVDFRGSDESGNRSKGFFSRVMKTLTK